MEGRYAGALYSAAQKEKKLDAVEKQLKEVKGLFDSDTKFRDFVLDPTYKRTDKKGKGQTGRAREARGGEGKGSPCQRRWRR